MALLHRATLTPSKLELVTAWLPSRSWAPTVAGPDDAAVPDTPDTAVRQLGAYRFDDPAGQVGLEALLLTAGGETLHVPLTYRAAPLLGAEPHLLGTLDHSVLGTRWVYDGCADPVWCAAAATAVLTGGTQAEEAFEVDGVREVREPSVTVRGIGRSEDGVAQPAAVEPREAVEGTAVTVGDVELVVVRRVGTPVVALATLEGRWTGGEGVLAAVRAVAAD